MFANTGQRPILGGSTVVSGYLIFMVLKWGRECSPLARRLAHARPLISPVSRFNTGWGRVVSSATKYGILVF